jgi:hypothetical protein
MTGGPNPTVPARVVWVVAMGRRDDRRRNMSLLSRGTFGAAAVSLAFGAGAWASDLAGTREPAAVAETTISEATINRAAKADRVTVPNGPVTAGAAAPMRTILLRLDALSDTSIAIRMPAAKEARNGPSAPSMIKRSSDRKAAVACEPPVSVLTEVAKQLQPGRCVT